MNNTTELLVVLLNIQKVPGSNINQDFNVLLTMHLSITLVNDQLDAQLSIL